MPRIFDNIERELLPALQETLDVSDRSDFCVGYFNLRGWKRLDSYVEKWSGSENSRCRLLVGMQRLPTDELREWLSLIHADQTIDNQTALRLKKKLAKEWRVAPCERLLARTRSDRIRLILSSTMIHDPQELARRFNEDEAVWRCYEAKRKERRRRFRLRSPLGETLLDQLDRLAAERETRRVRATGKWIDP